MRNGEGDQMLILFSNNGVCLNGFAHESVLNGWKKIEIKEQQSATEKWAEPKTKLVQEISSGVLEGLPEVFHEFIYGEPVKSIGTTFCIWQTHTENEWKTGNINLPNEKYKDGSSDLLQLLDSVPSTYKKWAEEYYEEELDQESIEKVFKGEIVTKELVTKLNLDLEDFEKLIIDLEEIGYSYKI